MQQRPWRFSNYFPNFYRMAGVWLVYKNNAEQEPCLLLHQKKCLAMTYSPTRGSTIGAKRLNFRVRNGNGWDPLAIVTRHH